jgi:hypothetical protein
LGSTTDFSSWKKYYAALTAEKEILLAAKWIISFSGGMPIG